MKFFVPGADNYGDAAVIYEATKKFAADSCGPITKRRIHGISFRHNGRTFYAEVGKIYPIVGETVVAILESNPYLICTPNRGVVRGAPILVGPQEIIDITDFDSDDKSGKIVSIDRK